MPNLHGRAPAADLTETGLRAYIAMQHNKGTAAENADDPLQSRVPAMSFLVSKIRNYLRYRETVQELSRLSNRDLDDLGISRSEIRRIARGNAV